MRYIDTFKSYVYVCYLFLVKGLKSCQLSKYKCLEFFSEKDIILYKYAQYTPAFSSPDQNFHGLFHFYIVVMYKKNSESVDKIYVIGLLKFTIVYMAENCHQPASFSKENMVFEDFFQLILNCFLCNCNIKVKKYMEFFVWV